MNITVPETAIAHFWEEPPQGHIEFWKFRFPVKCKVDDVLWFRYHGELIATAIVVEIIHQPQRYTDTNGVTFGPGYYVYWHPQTFVDRREAEGGTDGTAGTTRDPFL